MTQPLAILTGRDEFAPVKAAKQLRKGKRISEIEMLYGSQITNAAVESSETQQRPSDQLIPDLAPEFFASAFFRRFTVQSEYCRVAKR